MPEISFSPHLGVCLGPRSPSPVGPFSPGASFSATSPWKRYTQEQSGTPCRGTMLSPKCSWSCGPLPVHCMELQLTETDRVHSPEGELYHHSACETTSLPSCPSASTSTTTVAKAASPDSWSTAMTCKNILMLVFFLDHIITVFTQTSRNSPPVHVSGLVWVYWSWQSEDPPEWFGRWLCSLMSEWS